MSQAASADDFDTDSDIAVVGMAGRFPGARNIDEYWKNLRDGVESLTVFSDEELLAAGVDAALLRDPHYVKSGAVLPDMEMFDAPFFGFSPREASIMDPQHRHFLECSWEALENAGHTPERFAGPIGVFGGSGHNAYMPYNLLTNLQLMSSVGFFLVRHTGNDKDFLTTRVSYLLNLHGPSINVQTACSTSLVAIHLGCQSLLTRECDMALAGGVTIELPHRHGYVYREGEILSPDGHCHAFDADSQGTVFGSGVGVVVLRRLADALADGDHIHAVIKGSAINNDGSGKMGYLAPSVDGQADAISEALAVANVEPETISYIETHGTGTPVGDPIEIAALTQAFRRGTDKTGFCGVGSVKSNIGHTDTAAGVASFIKVALAMQHGQLPPSLHFRSPNPACEFERSPFYVNAALKPWNPVGMPRRAGVSSLGVGGTNAHIVMQQAPKLEPSGPSRSHQLLVLSAKTSSALDAATTALANHLGQHDALNLADAAYTLQIGRQAMKQRRILVASDLHDAASALAAADPQRVFTNTATDVARTVAFMFAGGGAQYPHMGADLYESEPVFTDVIDDCLQRLAKRSGADFRSLLFPAAGQEQAAAKQLERPSMALPMLFAVQVAQARLWMSWGLQPSAMIGHSMGEYTAAHLAGVFTLDDALALVELRGRLFESLPEGGMLSVPLSEVELKSLMAPELSIAAVNGPELCVASGPVKAIEALEKILAAKEIETARVRISVAAHSAMLEPILKEFGEFFRGVAMKPPSIPFVSNASGTWITAGEATDPAYWVRHLRDTVRFAQGLQELLRDDTRILLEVGPGRTLASLARQHPGRPASQPVFNSLRHPDEKVSDVAFVLGVLGRMWSLGAAVDWDGFRGAERRQRVPLPSYQFDHRRHWIEPGRAANSAAMPTEGSLEKRADLGQWFYQPVWKRAARPSLTKGAARSLVFQDACGLAGPLVERLRADGSEVVTVAVGKAFSRPARDHFTINPSAAADFDTLIAALGAEGRAPQDIYHLWTITGHTPCSPGVRAAEELQRLGFFSLLYLAQAIGHEDLSEPIRLAVVSDHLQRVAGEPDLVPAKATVLGPCMVIPREFPNISCHCIDVLLPPAGSPQERQLVEGLVAEMAAPSTEDVVAYRAAQRWIHSYEPASLPRPSAHQPTWRAQGVYLITGGLGGVGLALAEHLAASVKAKLVLVSRSGLPARKDWAAWLGQNAPEHATSRRIRQVMALEALGAEVLVVAADVTDLGQMKSAVKQARSRFGAIHGVLHTAGVLNDGVIQLKDAATAAAVLAPKLQGTLVLEAALGKAPLDFLVLFSSVSAFTGLAGQVDYAAANAFLDAYAQERVTRDGSFTVAVNWSQWQEVGMAASLAQQLGLSHLFGDDDGGTPVGHPLVDRCLRDSADERDYATRFSVRRHWLLDEHRVAGGEALIPGTGYLELVRAAFSQHPQARVLEMRDVTFLSPFVVRADEEKELRVQFRQTAQAASRFSIVSRAPGVSDDAAWIENVRGSVAYVDAPVAKPLKASEILARCQQRSQVFNGSERPVHLVFGPRWSNMLRIDYGAAEALVSLQLPDAYVADLVQFKLHPALMDMATGGVQALVPGFDEREDFFVPASYGCLRMHAPLTQKIFSHVRYRSDNAPGKDLATFDITVIDEQGTVLVEITEFTMIRLRDKALLAGAPVLARPRATANNVLALGLHEGILSAEGAEVLERVIAAGAGPQVVVSPQDLEALMRQLHTPPPSAVPADGEPEDGAPHRAGWKAPTTATEKLIAQMWSELLGVAQVSATDDFFDLGGHSLLAVQVINKLKKRTGKALPLTALLGAPTVETLAALIEPRDLSAATTEATEASTPNRSVSAPLDPTLVRIRPGGDKLPIFFIHDGNGETLLYRSLALLLDPGHAVYGLQPAVRVDGTIVHTRITDMAAAHIQQLRSVQPHGPYLMTGLCAGGVISFEMARQLQEAGETTLFLGLMDSADVKAQERPFRDAKASLSRFLGVFTENKSAPALERLRAAIPKMAQKTANFARYEVTSRLSKYQDARKVKALRDRSESAPHALQPAPDISYLKVYEFAHREHAPQGLFCGGDVVLFRGMQGDGSLEDTPYVEVYSDPFLGWQPRVQGQISIVDIPGGHSSMLQQPNVRVLAERLQEHIDCALLKAAPAQECTPTDEAA